MMRIYYQIGDTKIFPEDEMGEALGKSAESIHIIALELLKYKIMWALRSMEEEINKSEGVITIVSEHLGSKTNVTATGFEDDLMERIQAIARKTKF